MINQSATQLIDPTKQKNPIFIDEVVSQIFINRFAVYPWMTVSAKKLSYTCLPEGHNCLSRSAVRFILLNIKVLPGEIIDIGQRIVISGKFSQT